MAYVKYILKKLIQIVVITFLVSLLVFFSLRLNPTSPLTVIIGNKQSTPELQQQYTEQFDLDEPLLKQYIIWLKGIAHGDLGIDYVQKQPILNQIIDRIPITIGLVLFSTILGTVIAILIGVLAAMKRGTWIDSALSTLMLVISSIPTFVLSILAILFLSKYVPGYSFIGTYSNTAEFISRISVPGIIMAVGLVATLGRVTRSSMISQLQAPYMITAKAKGLGKFNKTFKHAFHNAVIPVLTVAGYMFAGGLISWIGLMPLINMFGDNIIMFPGDKAINLMSSGELWSNYIRYIGAGAVAAAGIISLVKTLPIIFSSFSETLRRKGENEENVTRLNKNIDNKLIWTGIVVIVLFLWLSPIFPINFPGAILIVIFGFFFATVSSRMVGLVGSSNNPVSGMAIATLIITGVILSSSGIKTNNALTGTIVVGSVICIVAAISGDTSQDLKTGYILGATPMKQQIGEIIGVVASSLAISGVLYLLNNAWGFGSSELPAPQATLMKIVVEGVMEGNLPWNLIMIGAAVAIAVEIMGVPALPFAVGMYLPIYLSAGIMLGGVVRFLIDKFADKVSEKGILVSSGMIAGEGLVGIILAILEVV